MHFPIEVPCIRVTQPLGEFFLCSIPASALKEVAFWIPAAIESSRGGFLKMFGIQRRMSTERAKQIGKYIDTTEATFPNTIIVSANFDEQDSHEDDEELRWVVSERGGALFLTIPSSKRLASVIDGQHRLAGFDFTESPGRMNMQLPCAVFLDLPKAYQANIFATINFNQKGVDKSLAYQLFGYELDESDNQKWTPNLVALFIARVLDYESTSPFKGHIKLALADVSGGHQASDIAKQAWTVSIAAVIEGIEKLISSRPAEDKHLLLSGNANSRHQLPADERAPLRALFLECNDKEIYRIVEAYFLAISEQLWSKASSRSFITRTVGILACFDILRAAFLRKVLSPIDISSRANTWIAPAAAIDFSDDYFHASGAGRVRIRNVLGISLGLFSYDELRGDATPIAVEALLKRYSIS